MRGIQCLLPCLSVAETSFKDDMGEMEKKMKVLQQEADQLKVYFLPLLKDLRAIYPI